MATTTLATAPRTASCTTVPGMLGGVITWLEIADLFRPRTPGEPVLMHGTKKHKPYIVELTWWGGPAWPPGSSQQVAAG